MFSPAVLPKTGQPPAAVGAKAAQPVDPPAVATLGSAATGSNGAAAPAVPKAVAKFGTMLL